MQTWNTIASDEQLEKTAKALEENGMTVHIVASGEEAKKKALELIPKGAEVMTATSVTADTIGLTGVINESGDYDSVKQKLAKMDRETQSLDMQKLGAAPDYITGSIHAVTEDGKAIIASNSGSQLPGYAYGASHVVWIVGAQKIVKNFDDAMKRIYEYVLPLESDRAHKAYGVDGSFVSKLLVFNRERPERVTIILVKEPLGF